MKKGWYWVIGIFVFLILISLLVPNNNSETNTDKSNSFDKTKFNELAIQSLYINGFCYEGMEADGLDSCGEAEYPFIRVYNEEDFEEQGKILLVTQVTDDLYAEFPELYDKEITYVFRDVNQQSVDRIYVKQDKWSR